MDLKTCIYQLRKDTGMSQREMARRAQVSHAEISRIEKGERLQPSPIVLKKLATVLGVKMELLLEAAGYIKSEPKDNAQYAEENNGNQSVNYQAAKQECRVPILCKEGGTASAYLDLQTYKNIDFALRVVDNKLAFANIYRGDLALCLQGPVNKDAKVLVVEKVDKDSRDLTLLFNNSAGSTGLLTEKADQAVLDDEYRVIGCVVAVLRNIEGFSYNQDMMQWQDMGMNAKKMGFTPDQVRWILQSQRQFLKKFYYKKERD